MFKNNFTKWRPLHVHYFNCHTYMVFIRGNLKTGMLQFKTKRILSWAHSKLPIDINSQLVFEELMKEIIE